MTSRERVKRSVSFTGPDRLPMDFPSCGLGDIQRVGPETRGKAGYQREGWGIQTDDWGCSWKTTPTTDHTFGHPVDYPLSDWSSMAHYRFPDPLHLDRYQGLDEELERAEKRGQYVAFFSPFTLFERLHMLRGFENLLMDLHLEQEKFDRLATRIVDYHLAVIGELKSRYGGRIDAYYMTDDWGTQENTLISVEMWRQLFKPLYVRLFRGIHEGGMHAYLHSCGKINVLLEELIDAGLDVINLRQPRLLGIEEVGKRLAGRLCFTASLDCQKTLPTREIPAIRQEAELLLRYWATDKGGFIPLEFLRPKSVGLEQDINWVTLSVFFELTGQLDQLFLQ